MTHRSRAAPARCRDMPRPPHALARRVPEANRLYVISSRSRVAERRGYSPAVVTRPLLPDREP